MGRKRKKYSKQFNRDYEFYLAMVDLEGLFCGEAASCWPYSESGVDAKRAFYVFDSTGKVVPTTQPELAGKIIFVKKCINFDIKLWVDGFRDYMPTVDDIEEKFGGESPRWVMSAFKQQLRKRWK